MRGEDTEVWMWGKTKKVPTPTKHKFYKKKHKCETVKHCETTMSHLYEWYKWDVDDSDTWPRQAIYYCRAAPAYKWRRRASVRTSFIAVWSFKERNNGCYRIISQWSFQPSCSQSDFKISNETKSNVYSDTKFSIIYIQIYNNAWSDCPFLLLQVSLQAT